MVGLLTEWERDDAIQRRGANDELGGTMRLGSYPCLVDPASLSGRYRSHQINERHRHRFEVNIAYRPSSSGPGLRFTGMSPDGRLPEIIELPDHPWFVGVQFHPELKSKPLAPHPLFAAFIDAAMKQSSLV